MLISLNIDIQRLRTDIWNLSVFQGNLLAAFVSNVICAGIFNQLL